MKKTLILVLLFAGTNFLTKGQKITKEEITGTWKVLNIEAPMTEISPEQQAKLDLVKDEFLKSKFIFKENGKFILDIDIEDLKQMMKNTHWRFNHSKSAVIIQEWKYKDKEKPSVMIIEVKKEGEKIFFLL